MAEFPLILPGYYYQELTASRFVHFYASYQIPLDSQERLLLRLEAATANADYLPGYEQPDAWRSGVGAGLTFTPRNKAFRVIARYGYGFNALRNDGEQGGHSVGLLMRSILTKDPNGGAGVAKLDGHRTRSRMDSPAVISSMALECPSPNDSVCASIEGLPTPERLASAARVLFIIVATPAGLLREAFIAELLWPDRARELPN